MVTLSNWEEYAILRADGELDVEGMAALETFLAAHPELAEEAKMFDSLRLVPDETVVFAGKESLLKHEVFGGAKPEPRVIGFDRRWVYGVAAGVVLLLGSMIFLRSGVEEGRDDAARLAGGVQMPVRVEKTTPSLPVAPQQNPITQSAAERNAIVRTTPAHNPQNNPEKAPQQNIVNPLPQREEDVPVTPESIQPLMSADARMLAVTAPQPPRAGLVVSPDAEPSFRSEPSNDSRRILDRLPIDAERFALVDDIRQTASDRIQSIRETREKIRNTDVTIALGKRDLFTLHF